MNRVFPSAEYLNTEEVDYELMIRSQPEDVYALDLASKQRLLRKLFKDDLKEGRSYRSPYTISVEAEHVMGRLETLEKALEKKVEAKYESRVIHYWYRVKWSKALGEEEKKIRRDLCRRIEAIMKHYQFGPPQSPIFAQINSIIAGNDQEGEVGGQNADAGELSIRPIADRNQTPEPDPTSEDDRTTRTPRTGAIPKQKPAKDQQKFEVTQEQWNEMQNLLARLTFHVSRTDQSNSQDTHNKGKASDVPNPFVFPPQSQPTTNPTPRVPIQPKRTPVVPPVPPKPTNRPKQSLGKPLNIYQGGGDDTSSGEESERRPNRLPYVPRHRHPREDEPRPQRHRRGGEHRTPEVSELDESSEPVYENTRHLRGLRQPRVQQGHRCYHGHQNRVEKWKLRFSGDQRSMSVETFLYKAKKLADREEVPRQTLLRDIHMLLDGPASDWFFTFVDELQTWDQFETSITYRFGNPNMDQGIRSKIQERRQQRGEPFIAFVSEIEKLDRLLSRPLSNRRKFEVIWDNMRQHYRSKISLVEVKDLRHLIRLNHRIDAADPQLQPQAGDMPVRRPVNQIRADGSDYESDQSASINAIGHRGNRNFRQENQQPNRREQQSAATQQGNSSQPNTLSCWNCQERGHSWRQCQKPKVVFCYGCGNLGRVIRSCERCSRPTENTNQNQGNE